MPDEKVKEENKTEQDFAMIRAEGLVKIWQFGFRKIHLS